MDPETLGMDYPEIGEIKELHQRKLYHDVYLRIEEFLTTSKPISAECLEYLEILIIPENYNKYQREALGFNIFCMEFSTLCIKIAKNKKSLNPGNAIKFLDKGLEFIQNLEQDTQANMSNGQTDEFIEAKLVLKSNQAILKFENDIKDEAKEILKEGDEHIRRKKALYQGVDSELYRQHYVLALNYYRQGDSMDAGKFLEAALRYLSYQDRNELDSKIQMGLARDITHAAIFSEGTFNFGKILFHPIMNCLEGTEHEDLLHLLKAFDQGDMDLFEQHAHCLEKNAPLTENQRKLLQEKMRLMCLMVMCWKLDPSQRCVTFRSIARCCKVPEDKVEIALMKGMSKGLIEGQIDQVHQRVTITKVQPRDIDVHGVDQLLTKVNHWVGEIENITDFVEQFEGAN